MQNKHLMLMLADEFPNKLAANGEILRLEAKMHLPKGTEYFFSDVHGEDRAFLHLVRSASGNIRRKIRDVYRTRLSETRQNELASIIYDPRNALNKRKAFLGDPRWVRETILQLVEVARFIASKYPRDDIRAKIPQRYSEIIEELFFTNDGEIDRHAYYLAMIDSIIGEDGQFDFIVELCHSIQKICVNHIHIVGDIYDRGPGPHNIMEELIDFDQVDIQWGNHDIVWMGAALGNEACMASVLRNAIRYNGFDSLEDGYSIHIRILNDFAEVVYGDDPCELFKSKRFDENIYDIVDDDQAARMHKAVAILEFKLEGQLLKRHPEYDMDDRIVLEKIDYEKGVFIHEGIEYPLKDTNFPTIDPEDPLELSPQEKDLMRSIIASFTHSEPLKRHMQFMYSNGSTYLTYNDNLLYHGCIPMKEDGSYDEITIDGRTYGGKSLMDYIDYMVTQAYYAPKGSKQKNDAVDFMWYLWCGKKSPLFGKSKMATFERYFLDEKALHKEDYNPYFVLSDEEEVCLRILKDFGLTSKHSHIINGHVPVKASSGEKPMKGNGRLFVIDGGIAKSYHKKTGINGYTLIFNSHHIALAEHDDYDALQNEIETYSPNVTTVDRMDSRMLIGDTDEGKMYRERIGFLKGLMRAYTRGEIKERY